MSETYASSEVVFRSIHHPGDRPYPLVYSQSVLEPLGVLFLPLMILTLISALQQGSLTDYLTWAFPLATVLALMWTAFRLRRTVAEVIVGDGRISIRSVYDVATGGQGETQPLFDARDYGRWMSIAAGDADVVIDRNSWPLYNEMSELLPERTIGRVAR